MKLGFFSTLILILMAQQSYAFGRKRSTPTPVPSTPTIPSVDFSTLVDTSFGNNGFAFVPRLLAQPSDFFIQANGDIVVTSSGDPEPIVMVHADGSGADTLVNSTFVPHQYYAVLGAQNPSKIVAYSDWFTWQFVQGFQGLSGKSSASVSFDISQACGPEYMQIMPGNGANSRLSAIVSTLGGKFFAEFIENTSYIPTCIVRFNGDGSIDTTFGNQGGFKGAPSESIIALEKISATPDGGLLYPADQGSTPSEEKVDINGNPDPNFHSIPGMISSIEPFTSTGDFYAHVVFSGFRRYKMDGTPDSTFKTLPAGDGGYGMDFHYVVLENGNILGATFNNGNECVRLSKYDHSGNLLLNSSLSGYSSGMQAVTGSDIPGGCGEAHVFMQGNRAMIAFAWQGYGYPTRNPQDLGWIVIALKP